MEEHCTTSSVPHDLTLSLLRLVLLPGYYFLWQHLSWRGEQRRKDSDRWLLCILWTGSPYARTEKCPATKGKEHSVCSTSVWETFSPTPNDLEAMFHYINMYAEQKNLTFNQGNRILITSFLLFAKEASLPSVQDRFAFVAATVI